MSWITLVAVLVTWCMIGLGVAYLFGRFIHGVESSGSVSDLPLPVVSYLRRVKRGAKASQTKTRREAIGGGPPPPKNTPPPPPSFFSPPASPPRGRAPPPL